MQDQVSDRAVVQAMLDVELALSWALVHCGLAPAEAATELAPACDASAFDLDALARWRASWGFFRDRRPELYDVLTTADGKRRS